LDEKLNEVAGSNEVEEVNIALNLGERIGEGGEEEVIRSSEVLRCLVTSALLSGRVCWSGWSG
jgi:hypothetical protein